MFEKLDTHFKTAFTQIVEFAPADTAVNLQTERAKVVYAQIARTTPILATRPALVGLVVEQAVAYHGLSAHDLYQLTGVEKNLAAIGAEVITVW